MASSLRLMDSFSQRERFVWMGDAFTVMIPNGSRTSYYARASLLQLKALLTPQLRLTRAGNISTHQPTPPAPQPYEFYLAQLIHYGLDFHFDSESAQRDLEIRIRLERLQVPAGLLELEKELKRAHEWKQNEAYEKAVRNASQQLRSHGVNAAIALGKSKHAPKGPEHESSQSPVTPKAPKRSVEKKKAVMDRSDDETSSSGPDDQTSSSGPDGDSGNESDTIAVAHDALQDTSSESSTSSLSESSSSALAGTRKMNNRSSKKSDKENRSPDDPFVDRQDSKRVKLDQADERHDSLLKSIREAAPTVFRKQPPPSQVKTRRIASQPLTTEQPINITSKEKPDTQPVRASFVSNNKLLQHQPSVKPHDRPSWNLPVRSPSSAPRDTPKSVTFSQVQRETPTRVPMAEKASFSSAMKTPQRSQHTRTPSVSSDHSHMTPLRSILKSAATPPQHQAAGNSQESEMNMQFPPHANTSTSRSRKRKRKRRADSGLGMHVDGAQDASDSADDLYKDKPHVVSDIVNGMPISYLNNGGGGSVKALQASPQHENARAVDKNRSGWVAVNAATYQSPPPPPQEKMKVVWAKQDAGGRPSPLSEMHLAGRQLDESILVPGKTARNGLGGVGNVELDGNGNGNGNGNGSRSRNRGSVGRHRRLEYIAGVGIRSTSSGGSRGGLVRAGGVY
jgi:hypothetical protein